MQTDNQILTGTKSTLSQYLIHWHRLSVDASLFIGTASVTVAGFAITRDVVTTKVAILCSLILVLLSLTGYFLREIINKQVLLLRGLIQKIDVEQGLFAEGMLSSGESLYPQEWIVQDTKNWNDPIFKFTLFTVVILPLVLILVILIAFWF